MLPALRPGQVVVGVWLPFFRPKVGSIVIAEVQGREVIKRIASVTPDGVYLLGDNSGASMDSREYGVVALESISCIIIFGIQK